MGEEIASVVDDAKSGLFIIKNPRLATNFYAALSFLHPSFYQHSFSRGLSNVLANCHDPTLIFLSIM